MMKSIVLLLLPITAAASLPSMWKMIERVHDVFKSPTSLSRSRIPQFILDARHPWIIENRAELERLPDVEDYLCSFSSSSAAAAAKGTRGETLIRQFTDNAGNETATIKDIPVDLFDYLEIDNNRVGVTRPGWPNALERLREMKRCPAALARARSLKVDVWSHTGRWADRSLWLLESRSGPSTELLDLLFADVLESMTGLERIDWTTPSEADGQFESYLSGREIELPSVRRLETGSIVLSLMRMCPNLEAFEGTRRQYSSSETFDFESNIPKIASLAPRLKRFSMTHRDAGWSPAFLEEVLTAMPALESLGMYGSLHWSHFIRSGEDRSEEPGQFFRSCLEVLRGLPTLTRLDLSDVSGLDSAWEVFAPCGNAYFGRDGRQYLRDHTRAWTRFVDRASSIIVETLPRLSGFSIGGDRPDEIVRHDNGTIDVRWPWTGRLDEYVIEAVPYRREVDGPDEL